MGRQLYNNVRRILYMDFTYDFKDDMKQIHECRPIREVMEITDTLVRSQKLAPELAAIVVEVHNQDEIVEGTLLYFPGVNSKQLLKGF